MANNNGFQNSYSNERPPSSQGEVEVTTDPASSSFFMNDYKKHEDIKQMLDGNKDNLKLEAMKRIIGMVAKGKDASDLFPAVVKNVVSKNVEVKKLVYVYLTRYAEEQQDLALLSISTFQRALKDPNQLIRGSALRVLSSIRVPMIIPIMMLAIKESVNDMSPYVRKTAAHAIPKLFSLDPDQKDLLIEVIEKLLADKTTLVAGSAIQAFEEVCPERVDLIHKNYRKLCNLLVDVEEWGQVVIINMLTRYCRLQFVSPNLDEIQNENYPKSFYESSDDSEKDHASFKMEEKKKTLVMDNDHRLLLRTCRPLLNSRNAAVVMAVAQLYHHCAPKSEVSTVAKALIRLLRGHKEVQFVVLTNIASMSVKQKSMFEPYLKSFYVRFNDPTNVKLLKLEILTNLGNQANISTILREFQTYVSNSDKELAAATIQSIGRCATSISEITDACLNGLVNLLSNRNEAVVGESVVVIKKLLQMRGTEHKEIIIQMTKLVDTISVPMAKASILWLIGEYSDRVPKIAPDVLRKMAKSFVDEEDIVKLQILNLATKLCITNPKQTKPLCQYVFNLAKYDVNYDIRDRTRFLRQLIFANDKNGVLAKHVKKIFLTSKPAPILESKFKDLDNFQLGTLSHMIGTHAADYQELPDWPLVAPDPSVRNIESAVIWPEKKVLPKHQIHKKKAFYSDEDVNFSSSATEDSSAESSLSEEETNELKHSTASEKSDSDKGSTSKSFSESSSNNEENKSKESHSSSDSEPELIKNNKMNEIKNIINGTDKDLKSKVCYNNVGKDKNKKTAFEGVDGKSKNGIINLDDDDENDSNESNDSESSEDDEKAHMESSNKIKLANNATSKEKQTPTTKSSELLLDLDIDQSSIMLTIKQTSNMNSFNLLCPVSASDVTLKTAASSNPIMKTNQNIFGSTSESQKTFELLNRIVGGGISITYQFTRKICLVSSKMVSIELVFLNESDSLIENIKLANKKLVPGIKIQDFPEIGKLEIGSTSKVNLYVDFNDTTQPAQFDIVCSNKRFNNLVISPPVGELLRPNTIDEKEFHAIQKKLGGMNENSCNIQLSKEINPQLFCNAIFKATNVLYIPSSIDNVYLFAAKTLSTNADLLVSLELNGKHAIIKVNCEKIVITSMILNELKESINFILK